MNNSNKKLSKTKTEKYKKHECQICGKKLRNTKWNIYTCESCEKINQDIR